MNAHNDCHDEWLRYTYSARGRNTTSNRRPESERAVPQLWFLPHCIECRVVKSGESCLSVRPSVKRVHCEKAEERSVQMFIPYKRTFSLIFWEEEWLVGVIHSTWNFGSTGRHWNEITDFEPLFAHSTSAVTPSEKSSINTNRKSTTGMCFPMSIRGSSYVALSAQKRKTAVFGVKSHFAWRKSATKFLCVKTVSKNDWWGTSPCT